MSNCRGQSEQSTFDVDVPAFTPLIIDDFKAQLFCFAGLCDASPGTIIPFALTYQGTPTEFAYDWDGDGTFEDTNNTSPVTQHTYPSTQTGLITPAVRISAGSASVIFIHANALGFSAPQPPSVTVSGTTTLLAGGQATYTASAANCTPAPTSFTFSATGGAISTTTATTATVSWPTPGSGSVRAVASGGGCNGTAGTRFVTVTGGTGPGPSAVTAAFNFAPSAPDVDEAISFNASTSSGSPTTFLWDFGDGATAGPSSASSVSHKYSATGNYTVTLEVGKVGSCANNFCSDSTTKTVTVANSVDPTGGLVAQFLASPLETTAGVPVTFDASPSAGGATTYEWDFDDGTVVGPSANLEQTSYIYTEGGVYKPQLTIRRPDRRLPGRRLRSAHREDGHHPRGPARRHLRLLCDDALPEEPSF